MLEADQVIKSFLEKSTDFIVGDENFSNLEIRSDTSQSKFFYFYDTQKNRLIKQFVLCISKTGIKTCCNVTFIEKDGKYTPRIELSKRKDGSLEKESLPADDQNKLISARVSLDECYENFWILIDYIQSLKNVDVPRGGLVAVSKEEKSLIRSFGSDSEFIQKVLSTFSTPEAQSLLIEAKKDDVNNLYASVRQAKNKKALHEIEGLIIDEASEHKLEHWIKENDWVFGIEYIRRLDATRIGLHSDTDLLVESLDGFVDLIELKKASTPRLFIHDDAHGCYYPSKVLSQVIGQTIHYLCVMEDSRLLLKSYDDVNVLRPRAKIVIGQSSNMAPEEKEALRKLNDTLHNIEVITYDEIKHRAHRIVEHYSQQIQSEK